MQARLRVDGGAAAMISMCNCRISLHRIANVNLGRDVATGERRQYAELNARIAPVSTQTAATRELGIISNSTYSLHFGVDNPEKFPKPGDMVRIDDVFYRNSWANELAGRWFEITDVAGTEWNIVRILVRETHQ